MRQEEVKRQPTKKKGKEKNICEAHLSDPRYRLKDQVFDKSGGVVRRALRLGQRHEPQRERREVRRQAVPDHSPSRDQKNNRRRSRDERPLVVVVVRRMGLCCLAAVFETAV